MKNSLNTNYVGWLQKYNSNNHSSIPYATEQLIVTIQAATSIEALIALFTHHLDPEIAQYNEISFNTQLVSWRQELEKIAADQQLASAALNKVERTAENEKLIFLLQEIINNPSLLLHTQIPSLLRVLQVSSLTDLIQYIVHLPKVDPPLKPRSGSFAAQQPLSTQHGACLDLLNNLAAKVNEQSTYWDNANSLLQSALRIYQELELVEVSLEVAQTVAQKEDKSFCNLM